MEAFDPSYVLLPIMAFFGFLLRRLFVKLDSVKTEKEIRQMFYDQLAPMRVRHEDIEDDIRRIELKLDKILDLIINDRRK